MSTEIKTKEEEMITEDSTEGDEEGTEKVETAQKEEKRRCASN